MMWSRRLQTSLAFMATSSSSRTHDSLASAFSSPQILSSCVSSSSRCSPFVTFAFANDNRRGATITQQYMSFNVQSEGGIPRIDMSAMKEIIEDVANSSREESGYIIIDVRGHDEVQRSGKLNDVVETLPLPYIAEGALAMNEDDFQEAFGFDKPSLDETIVFSCAAGIRSQHAAQFAKMAGYSDILDYMGGSNEWFSS